MSIINRILGRESVSKSEIEQVQKEKEEYKLLSKYSRTKGLKLYSYNSMKDELVELKVEPKTTIKLVETSDGGWNKEDVSKEECTVDSRNIHFEALNQKNAEKRVKKYKNSGKLDKLCNLKPPADLKALSLW